MNMSLRLTKEEVAIIKETAKEIFGEDVKVYIFGSRTDPTKRGGDLDIFLETAREVCLQEELKFLARLERRGIERKVDLIVKKPSSKERAIFKEAKEKGVLI